MRKYTGFFVELKNEFNEHGKSISRQFHFDI